LALKSTGRGSIRFPLLRVIMNTERTEDHEMSNKIIIGTTPDQIFTIPFDVSDIKTIVVSYGQDNTEVFFKTNDDCTMEGNEIKLKLTQEDTFKLIYGKKVQIQLNILRKDGEKFTSDIIENDVDNKVLHMEVLT
jgi:hypothetical protein